MGTQSGQTDRLGDGEPRSTPRAWLPPALLVVGNPRGRNGPSSLGGLSSASLENLGVGLSVGCRALDGSSRRKETRSVGWMRAELADKLFRFLMMELQPTILPPPPGYRAPSPPGFGIGVGFRAASPTGLHLTKSTYAGIRLVVLHPCWLECPHAGATASSGTSDAERAPKPCLRSTAFGSMRSVRWSSMISRRAYAMSVGPRSVSHLEVGFPERESVRNARTRTGTPDRRKIRGC